MTDSKRPRIVFSEWLPTGVMIHFETDVSVFFPSDFLYEQRERQPDYVFHARQEQGQDDRFGSDKVQPAAHRGHVR